MAKSTFGNGRFDKAYFTGKSSCGYAGGYSVKTLRDYDCYTRFKEDAKLINNLGIKTYLEIGCACGYLMQELIKHGISVTGWDVSEYIIKKADPRVRPFIELKDIKEIAMLPDKSFDLVHISNVLGYVPLDKLDFYLAQIKRVAKKYAILYAGTPEDSPEENEIRKINKSDEWWNEQYGKYFREKDLSQFLWEVV
jgi:SAM-dependent methyltransferase